MAVPYTFGTATAAIPLSQLDSNFATAITIGNTAVQLGNTVTTLNNMTLANVTISSGNVTITNVSVTTANVSTANIGTSIVTGNETVGGNVTVTGNVSMNVGTITTANVTTANIATSIITSGETLSYGTANGVAYLNGSKALTTGSALTFDGTNLGIGTSSPTQPLSIAKGVGVAAYLDVAGGGRTLGTTSFTFGQASDGVVAFFQRANADMYWTINSSEKMRIGAATGGVGAVGIGYTTLTSVGDNGLAVLGNVGIGTSSPNILSWNKAETLNTASGNAAYELAIGGAAQAYFAADGSNVYLAAYANKPLLIRTNNATVATFDTSGNLGLGVTPSGWWSGRRAFQLGNTVASIAAATSGNAFEFGFNRFLNSSVQETYVSTGAAALYAIGAGTHTWYNAPSGTAGNPITFTQAMTLNAVGNLLLGSTTAPTGFARISLVGGESSGTGANSGVQFTYNSSTYGGGAITTVNAAGGGMSFYTFTGNVGSESYTERARIDSSGTFRVKGAGTAGSTDAVQFSGSAPASAMSLNASGNLGIQTGSVTSALALRSVTGDLAQELLQVIKYDNNTTTSQVFQKYYVNNGASACGQINANGANTAAFGTTSDKRLKENIKPLPPQLNNILALKPSEFDYIELEGGGHQIGFIAQEMQAVYPDVVGKREDDMLMITGWSKTEARLVKAIQEQNQLIQSLTDRISALEGAKA